MPNVTHEHKPGTEHDYDFEDMSPEELHILTDDHSLDVFGTGKNGNVLKADRVAALELVHPERSGDVGDTGDTDDGTIKRENEDAWWCPRCDHSQTQLIDTCGGCGAVRDGDRVTR